MAINVIQPQNSQNSISIGDILKMKQMADANNKERTYTSETGAPELNGTTPPVPMSKPDLSQAQQTGTLSSILDGIKAKLGGIGGVA